MRLLETVPSYSVTFSFTEKDMKHKIVVLLIFFKFVAHSTRINRLNKQKILAQNCKYFLNHNF